MNPTEVAAIVDHTMLASTATRTQVSQHISEAIELGTYSVCISPAMLPVELPEACALKVVAVCGFPSGKHSSRIKAAEAMLAVENGADEIDMVIDVGAAVERDFAAVEADIAAVREAVPAPTVLKVIIESAALEDNAIIEVCRTAVNVGADFVKTSTGFHPAGGASAHAVHLMATTVTGQAEVKASGGVRTMADAQAMIKAGATRLGISGTRALLSGEPASSGY